MKKNIILLLTLTVVPYVLCLIFSLFSKDIRIGQGGTSLESHLLNKEVLIEMNGLYKSIDVEEYLAGVLPGTIAVDYDEEALKAQAILIRTNVLKEMEEKGTADAKDLSYQYLTVEDRIALFGERNYERYQDIFERAVVDTAGLVIRQEGTLIMALYHEVSIGKTASAKEILGEDIAYLQSVDSGKDVEAKHYMNVMTYSWSELQELEASTKANLEEEERIGTNTTEKEEDKAVVSDDNTKKIDEETTEDIVQSDGEKEINIQVTESSENGFVKKLSVDGTIYTGEEAMERFGLTSTNFYVENVDGGVRFVCLGKGACMGVSQYGANRMALDGAKAEEIIRHYYTKVSIESYSK